MLGKFKNALAGILRRYMARADAKHELGKTLPNGVVEHSDIAYGKAEAHKLDVYVPIARTNVPVIVDVHGGALIYGRKELNKRFCYALARLGLAVVSVDYRLVPDVTALCQIRDVVSSLRWTVENIRAYGGNPNEAYLCGDSAGAFLALFAAACDCPEIAAAFGTAGANFRTRGCFFISGLYDMHRGLAVKALRNFSFGDRKNRLRYKYTRLEELFKKWSPPPCFLVSSRGDFLRGQTENFAAALSALGSPFASDCALRRSGAHKYSHIYPVKNPEWEESGALLAAAVKYLFRGGKLTL